MDFLIQFENKYKLPKCTLNFKVTIPGGMGKTESTTEWRAFIKSKKVGKAQESIQSK